MGLLAMMFTCALKIIYIYFPSTSSQLFLKPFLNLVSEVGCSPDPTSFYGTLDLSLRQTFCGHSNVQSPKECQMGLKVYH